MSGADRQLAWGMVVPKPSETYDGDLVVNSLETFWRRKGTRTGIRLSRIATQKLNR